MLCLWRPSPERLEVAIPRKRPRLSDGRLDALEQLEGFQGIIHGGIVSTVLDEAMSKAVAAAAKPAFTCHLEVRLRRPVAPGEPLVVRAWVVKKRKRYVRVEAELRDRLSVERAHAWATFLEVLADSGSSTLA